MLQKNQSFFVFMGLLALSFMVACTSSGGTETGGGTTTENVDTLPPEPPVPVMGFDCASLAEDNFCSMGFSFIHLGDTLMWVDLPVPEVASIKDSVLVAAVGGDTLAANIRTLSFDDGKVILESDWQGALYLNKIEITTAYYQNTVGLKVGSTVADLRATYPELQARSYPEFGIAEIFPMGENGNPYMTFHIEDPSQQYVDPADTTYSAAGIPDEAKIVRIVVM